MEVWILSLYFNTGKIKCRLKKYGKIFISLTKDSLFSVRKGIDIASDSLNHSVWYLYNINKYEKPHKTNNSWSYAESQLNFFHSKFYVKYYNSFGHDSRFLFSKKNSHASPTEFLFTYKRGMLNVQQLISFQVKINWWIFSLPTVQNNMHVITLFALAKVWRWYIDPPGHSRIGGHYFHVWCPSVCHKN